MSAKLKASILMVEDNSADAGLMRELMFERAEDVAIHWVTNGQQAIDYLFRQKDYADAERPDVVLLDLSIPRISGYDVLKKIRADQNCRNIPVIVLTTSTSNVDENRCKESGASLFLSKPFSLKGYEEMCQYLVSEVLPGMLPQNDNDF